MNKLSMSIAVLFFGTPPALIAVLFFATPLYAVDIKVPDTVKGQPSTFIQIKAETTGKVVKWKSLDPDLSLFPTDLLKDTKTAVVVALRPGKFRLVAVTAAGDEPSDLALVVIDTTDGKPTPPNPPTPTPPTPLTKSLQEAYNKAKDQESLALLKSLYEQASDSNFLDKVSTWKQLSDTMGGAAQQLGVRGKLQLVQSVLANEMKSAGFKSADSNVALDADSKKLIADTFTNIAAALGALK